MLNLDDDRLSAVQRCGFTRIIREGIVLANFQTINETANYTDLHNILRGIKRTSIGVTKEGYSGTGSTTRESTHTRRTAETIIVKAESVRVGRNLVAYKPEPLHTIVGAAHLNRFASLSRV